MLRDIAMAAERLRHTLLLKKVPIDVDEFEDHGYVPASHCSPHGCACVRAMVLLEDAH